MSDIEYSVIKSEVIKSFDCISNTNRMGKVLLQAREEGGCTVHRW